MIRVPLPTMNEQRRKELVKVVHKLAEEGRIAVRHCAHRGARPAQEADGVSRGRREARREGPAEGPRRLHAQDRRAPEGKGSRDHGSLTRTASRAVDERRRPARADPRSRRGSAARGHHHGRQRAVGARAAHAPAVRPSVRDEAPFARWSKARSRPASRSSRCSRSRRRTGSARRPRSTALMSLLEEYVAREADELHAAAACACACWARSTASRPSASAAVERVVTQTARQRPPDAQPVHLVQRARGARARGARCWRADAAAGRLDPDRPSTKRRSRARLYTADCPDPDLLIRTSGEQRISNFLLWQLAYSELFISARCCGPTSRARELYEAIRDFQLRERRFGRVPA